jgi:hypothetical protein
MRNPLMVTFSELKGKNKFKPLPKDSGSLEYKEIMKKWHFFMQKVKI